MTDPNHQKILDKVDASREHAVGFLQKMVAIPSVTGDEAAIQRFVSNYMKEIGLKVDVWETDWEALKKHPGYRPVQRGYEGRPNIVGVLKGSGGGRSLLLNGHTDVIPVGESWSDDPWSGRIKNGRIYGRGSCDMKSGVASHILAVQYLKELGLTPKGDVMINVVIDEEVSGHGTLDTVIRGYKADAGISGETSDLAVQPACIGRIWFEIEIRGKPAGIQKRYEGISGIDLGNRIAKAVADLEAKRVATVTARSIRARSIHCPVSSAAFRRAAIRAPSRRIACSRAALAPSRARTTKASSKASSIRWRAPPQRILG